MFVNKYIVELLKQLGYTCHFEGKRLISITDSKGNELDRSDYQSHCIKMECYEDDNVDLSFTEDGLDIDIYSSPFMLNTYVENGSMFFTIHDYTINNSETQLPDKIQVEFKDYDYPGRSYIKLLVGTNEVMRLSQYDIYAEVFGKGFNYQLINAEKISTENYVNVIINYLRNYNHSSNWTEGVKKGLQVLLPVLTMRVNDFINIWYKNLDKYIKDRETLRESHENAVRQYQRYVAQDGMYIEILNAIKDSKKDSIKRRK